MAIITSNKEIERPRNPEEFLKWFEKNHGYNHVSYPGYYDMATNRIKSTFIESTFWKRLSQELPNINDMYFQQKAALLLTDVNPPEIHIKPLESLLIKAYRKNILNNNAYPEEPKGGWITSENWLGNINDILRTTIIVKYLDGVEFLLNQMKRIAEDTGCRLDYSLEAREEGYYAAHAGVKMQIDIYDRNYVPISQNMNIEIQVTTELQAIIKQLLHKHYERNRKQPKPANYMWQWDYHCDEFASNYLGHIVHYVEGMIIELRDKK